jgi:hypothetical protein
LNVRDRRAIAERHMRDAQLALIRGQSPGGGSRRLRRR